MNITFFILKPCIFQDTPQISKKSDTIFMLIFIVSDLIDSIK